VLLLTFSELDIKSGSGNADALFISSDIEKPEAGQSQALVKIKAFGLNRMDLLQREGHYPVPPQAGKILGVEFSGTVEALGPDVKENFKVGDEVFGLGCQLINSLYNVFPN
jgi:NADPH:quinone reductase-like Zn-dependent oxidoreductase